MAEPGRCAPAGATRLCTCAGHPAATGRKAAWAILLVKGPLGFLLPELLPALIGLPRYIHSTHWEPVCCFRRVSKA